MTLCFQKFQCLQFLHFFDIGKLLRFLHIGIVSVVKNLQVLRGTGGFGRKLRLQMRCLVYGRDHVHAAIRRTAIQRRKRPRNRPENQETYRILVDIMIFQSLFHSNVLVSRAVLGTVEWY